MLYFLFLAGSKTTKHDYGKRVKCWSHFYDGGGLVSRSFEHLTYLM